MTFIVELCSHQCVSSVVIVVAQHILFYSIRVRASHKRIYWHENRQKETIAFLSVGKPRQRLWKIKSNINETIIKNRYLYISYEYNDNKRKTVRWHKYTKHRSHVQINHKFMSNESFCLFFFTANAISRFSKRSLLLPNT